MWRVTHLWHRQCMGMSFKCGLLLRWICFSVHHHIYFAGTAATTVREERPGWESDSCEKAQEISQTLLGEVSITCLDSKKMKIHWQSLHNYCLLVYSEANSKPSLTDCCNATNELFLFCEVLPYSAPCCLMPLCSLVTLLLKPPTAPVSTCTSCLITPCVGHHLPSYPHLEPCQS